jgi:hypothetical protein
MERHSSTRTPRLRRCATAPIDNRKPIDLAAAVVDWAPPAPQRARRFFGHWRAPSLGRRASRAIWNELESQHRIAALGTQFPTESLALGLARASPGDRSTNPECADTGALRQPALPGLRAPTTKRPRSRAKEWHRAMTRPTARDCNWKSGSLVLTSCTAGLPLRRQCLAYVAAGPVRSPQPRTVRTAG